MKAKMLIEMISVGALLLLTGCSGDKEQMLQQLEGLEQQNRSGQPMLNDSLAESLVNYFDRHGDANERMRSRYILGRTYYCLDELPRALEIYNEAADCADTTSADCNYKVLSRIHAQSAVIFNLQVQPRSQLDELRMAEYYAWRGKDTLQAIECYAQQGDVFAFWGMADSAIYIKEKASTLFKSIGKENRAYQTERLRQIYWPLMFFRYRTSSASSRNLRCPRFLQVLPAVREQLEVSGRNSPNLQGREADSVLGTEAWPCRRLSIL
jgi:tetratricopeptide (TPR) repeat protein